MINEIQLIKTNKKELQKFGLTFSIILGIIGGFLLYKGNTNTYWFLSAGALFLFLGMFLPQSLKLIYKIWMGLALIIGWFMSRLILSALFYMIVTPIGLCMRLVGKDFLNQKFDKSAETYWIKRDKEEFARSRYERLF
jgi:hypothetical protein